MADTVKQVDELRVKCTLRNGATQTTRTLTVNNPKPYDNPQRLRMIALRDKLTTGSLSGVIQPSSWRDGSEDIEPYETAAVEFAYFNSTEILRDINEEPTPTPISIEVSPATKEASAFYGSNTEYVTFTISTPVTFVAYTYSVVGKLPYTYVEGDIDLQQHGNGRWGLRFKRHGGDYQVEIPGQSYTFDVTLIDTYNNMKGTVTVTVTGSNDAGREVDYTYDPTA